MVSIEGPLALWKGLVPTFIASIPLTLSFGYFDLFKRLVAPVLTSDPYSQTFIAGSLTGAANVFLICPFDRVRVIKQATKGKQSVNFKNVYDKAGLQGLYKGFSAFFLRETIGCGFYFSVYDYALSRQEEIGSAKLMVAGGLAGVSFWSAIFPIDCIKTRMQADDLAAPKYRGSLDCLRQLLQNEGVTALYRGYFAVILRTIPANAIFILLYGHLLRYSSFLYSQP